jgi:hypothetical protein
MTQDERYLLILFLWISSWNLVDLTVNEFVPKYKYKMLLYAVMFLVSILLYTLL